MALDSARKALLLPSLSPVGRPMIGEGRWRMERAGRTARALRLGHGNYQKQLGSHGDKRGAKRCTAAGSGAAKAQRFPS